MNKVIVFAGTTEGREICSFLKKYEIASLACTATEYGKCRIEEGGALTVRSGRLTEEEILSWIRETGVKNVTLTGGEPLLRKGMEELIEAILEDSSHRVEIETNGSVDLKPYHILKKCPSFTMDYKTPDSGMEKEMLLSNLELLGSEDTLKFVVSSRRDMEKALEILEKYRLVGKTAVYFSPVFGRIQPVEIVDFLMEKKLNDVKLQIQLHKVIWDPQKRGV